MKKPFELDEDQQLIVESVRDLMESENWDAYFYECDQKHEYPARFAQKLGELGIHQMLLDPEEGGLGENAMTTYVAAWEEILRLGGNAASVWATTSNITLMREGTEEQKAITRKLMESNVTEICQAATEPGAGSDLGNICSTYTRRNGKIYLNGHKTFCTDANEASYICFLAKDSDHPDVYTLFFIPMNLPGITKRPLDKLGLRTNSACELYFEEVEVEEKDILGTEGYGFDVTKDDFNTERLITGMFCYGYALCAFEDAAKYANQREQFGEAIGRTELIQLKLADMVSSITNMRNMTYYGAALYDNGELDKGYASMCKYYCVNAAQKVIDDAIQILGGIGICGGHRVGRAFLDVRGSRIAGGTDEMSILTLGRSVLKKYR